MIAVSGGGIAGLAAGIAVLRNRIPLLFVAGSTLPATALLGGVQIAPNGWDALEYLGLGSKYTSYYGCGHLYQKRRSQASSSRYCGSNRGWV